MGRLIWIWTFLILGIILIGGITIISKNQPLLEGGFKEIITRVYAGKEELKQEVSKPIKINPLRTRYNGNYKVLKKEGDEANLDVSFTKTPVTITTPINLTHNYSSTRYDTNICLKAGFDETEIITYKEPLCTKNESQSTCISSEIICTDQRSVCIKYASDNVTCVNLWQPCAKYGINCTAYGMQDVCIQWAKPKIESSYNYTVPSALSFYKEKTLSKQTDLVKAKANQLSQTSPSNPNTFCYQANPEKDFYLKFGENSIIIIQSEDVTGDSLLANVTAETGDANFTHLTIDDSDDVYLEFDGSGDSVDFGFPIALGKLTISWWMKTPHDWTARKGVIDIKNSFEGVALEPDSGVIRLRLGDSNTVLFSNAPADLSDWHHFAVVLNGSGQNDIKNATIYVDATSLTRGSPTASGSPEAWTELEFGGNSYGDFTGSIDEIRLYNLSLNQANITEIYNSGRVENSSLLSNNLTGWWKLDEAAGISADDSSGEGNDGTLVGDTSWSTWGLGDNLVGYWNFDGDNVNSPKNTSYDFSKNNNDGTMVADAVVNSSNCIYGDCLQLVDGTNSGDYILADTNGDGFGKSICENGCSFSVWAKKAELTSTGNIIGRYLFFVLYVSSAEDIIFLFHNDSSTQCLARGENPHLLDTEWHHYVGVFDNSTGTGHAIVYLDGAVNKDQTCTFSGIDSTTWQASNEDVFFGTTREATIDNEWNGTIDEVMIFNSTLTPAQILDIYNNHSARFNVTGTQKVRAVKVTNGTTWNNGGYNRVNLTTSYETNMKSNISARIGQINMSVNNSGLILYMPFEWGSAVDISGYGNDGTLVGDAFINESGLNDTLGLQLDGTDDYVDVGTSSSLDSLHNDVTVSIWSKANVVNVHLGLITFYLSDGERFIIWYNPTGTDSMDIHNDINNEGDTFDFPSCTTADVVNSWTHWTILLNETNARIYKNGGLCGTNTIGLFNFSQLGDGFHVDIGTYYHSSSASFLNGTIDEVMIFNRSLSAQEVSDLYTNQSGGHNIPYYTEYKNITGEDNFTINPEADFIFPDFLFYAGNSSHPFYTPLLLGDITLETYTIAEEEIAVDPAPKINFTSPTPANASSQAETYVTINVSIIDNNLTDIVFNWNGTNTTIFNDSLVLFMNFDNRSALGEQTSGANNKTVDISGYGNDGIFFGDATINLTGGKYSGGLQLDGAGDYAEFSVASDIVLDNIVKKSISLWVKPIDDGSIFITKGRTFSAAEQGWALGFDNTGDLFYQHYWNETVGNWDSDVAPADDGVTWNHIVLTYDSSSTVNEPIFYVNGVLAGTTEIANPAGTVGNNSANSVIMGRNYGLASEFFNGTIDDVMIWNRSLSSDEIQQLYFTSLTKYNLTDWSLYVNQSLNSTDGLSDGDYTYQAYASDNNSNWNSTELRTITITTDSCSCPPSGNFIIINGDICSLATTCNIGTNIFRVNDGAMLIQSSGYLRAGGGCFVADGERFFVDDGGGLFCG